jgi:hypothetical protein
MWYDKLTPKYRLMLCGCENRNLINSSNWIYWARHPCNLENLEIVSYNKRQFLSIFIGLIENEVQAQYRHNDWKKNIEIFDILIAKEGLPYKYTNKEYLDILRYSKFGLCLRGFGPKCHREVELMACGSIPIITTEVDIDNYYNPPIENIHYIRVNKPDDIPIKINTINQEKWEQMSKACVQWYNENCSIQGSFNIKNEIIENLKGDKKIESISTLTNINGIYDLTILLNSLSKFNKDIPVFIACDTAVKNHFEKNYYGLTLYFETCLDKYNGMNRQQIEQNALFLDFTLEKETVLRKAMTQYSNCLFLDSDICILDSLPNIDFSKDVILCRHFIKEENEKKYGHFNVGYFFVNNINNSFKIDLSIMLNAKNIVLSPTTLSIALISLSKKIMFIYLIQYINLQKVIIILIKLKKYYGI